MISSVAEKVLIGVILFMPLTQLRAACCGENCYVKCPSTTLSCNWCDENAAYCKCRFMHGYYCECECYDENGVLLSRVTRWCPKGSKGCPYLIGWQKIEMPRSESKIFFIENTLLSGSEFVSHRDVTDYYPLENPLGIYEGFYWVDIVEWYKEQTRIDEVKLLAVDHPKGTYLSTTPDGEILVWENTTPPLFCTDQNGENHLSEIIYKDGVCFEGTEGDVLTIGFGKLPNNGGVGIRAHDNPPDLNKKDEMKACISSGFALIPLGSLYERNRGWTPVLNLSDYAGREWLLVLEIHGELALIDQIFLFTQISEKQVQECSLYKGFVNGINVTSAISQIDGEYAYVDSTKTLSILFSPPSNSCPEGWERDFIFVVTGRYDTPSLFPGLEEEKELREFLFSVFPNMVEDYINIQYVIPRMSRVSIKIYDVTGRMVYKIVEGLRSPGKYTLVWDGTDSKGRRLPKGGYFIEFKAGSIRRIEKVIIK